MLKTATLLGLISRITVIDGLPSNDIRISGVVMDSRKVQPGCLFVAIGGGAEDGHAYIQEALSRGAAAIVGEKSLRDLGINLGGTPYLQVLDGRLAVSQISAAFYGFPAHEMVVIGVTGTDGKTTTATIIQKILLEAGLNAGLISTVNAVIQDQSLDTGFHVTTPDAPIVQNLLAQMVLSGVTHVIVEATSHGLAQFRVNDCEFDMAVLTNLTHEHLDYHQTFDAYRSSKGRLFKSLQSTHSKSFNPPRGAVLNKDDDSYQYFEDITKAPVLSYGIHSDASVTAREIIHSQNGLRFTAVGHDLEGRKFQFPVVGKLFGEFNVYNYLAAAALTRGVMQIDSGTVAAGIGQVDCVPGRMEKIDLGQDFTALVDFAHTPNALQKALLACRERTSGRVIAVVGSAGLRDRDKRSLMGSTAAKYADLVIITAEDPRSESLAGILAEVAAGARKAAASEEAKYRIVPDRREAIRAAVRSARPGDIILICGKGHEQSMCIGDVEYPWDDRTALRAALSEQLGVKGPDMPYLPDSEG
jgi:UDP-N-acetylmuramoyl-L-alanyl-D-glutamate--2,6-diaminopimelate ligase